MIYSDGTILTWALDIWADWRPAGCPLKQGGD